MQRIIKVIKYTEKGTQTHTYFNVLKQEHTYTFTQTHEHTHITRTHTSTHTHSYLDSLTHTHTRSTTPYWDRKERTEEKHLHTKHSGRSSQ